MGDCRSHHRSITPSTYQIRALSTSNSRSYMDAASTTKHTHASSSVASPTNGTGEVTPARTTKERLAVLHTPRHVLAPSAATSHVTTTTLRSPTMEPNSTETMLSPNSKSTHASIQGVAQYILENDCRNIIVMVGAGISTAAGIPDFRSPKSGLYANLEKYDLPAPEALFDLGYLQQKPEKFYQACADLHLWEPSLQNAEKATKKDKKGEN